MNLNLKNVSDKKDAKANPKVGKTPLCLAVQYADAAKYDADSKKDEKENAENALMLRQRNCLRYLLAQDNRKKFMGLFGTIMCI